MGRDDREQPDVSRRDLGALLGVLGGGAALSALSACSNSNDGGIASQVEHITGTSIVWFNTINGPCTTGTTCLTDTAGPSDAYQVAIVFGVNTPGDGGGGVFYWDYTSTATDDGGTIFQVLTPPVQNRCGLQVTTGRWIRIYSGPLNVKWFGAIGDGSTHTPDESVAFSSAIAAAAASGCLAVLVPAGTYVIATNTATNAAIQISNANLTLAGQGPLATVIKAASTVDSATIRNVIQVGGSGTPTSGVSIRDLTIDANALGGGGNDGGSGRTVVAGYPAHAATIYCDDFLAVNVTVTNTMGIGNTVANGLAADGSRNRIESCTAINCGSGSNLGDGFYVGPSSVPVNVGSAGQQNLIVGCVANSCTGSGFVVEGCNASGIVGCTATGCGNGASISNNLDSSAGVGNFMSGVTVNGATGTNGGAVMVEPTSANGIVRDTTLTNITIRANGASGTPALWIGSISTSVTQIVQAITINGIHIDWTGSGQSGIGIAPGTTDVDINGGCIFADLGAIGFFSTSTQACKRCAIPISASIRGKTVPESA